MTSGFAPSPGSSTTLKAEACATRLHGPTTNSLRNFHRRPILPELTARAAMTSTSGSARFALGFGFGTGSPNKSFGDLEIGDRESEIGRAGRLAGEMVTLAAEDWARVFPISDFRSPISDAS